MAQYELNFQDYLRIFKKRRWIIILTAVAVIGSVMVFTNLQTPIYQAAATVKVEANLAIPGVSTDQSGWDSFTALNTEVKIIKSAVVGERAARKLGLLSPDLPESARQAIIGSIQSKISAERLGETNLISVQATSSDPKETASLANATAEVYIEKGIEDRSRRARELREFIEAQMRDAETKLKAREDELRSFTERNGVKGVGGYLSQRMVDLQNRKSELLKKYTEQHPEVQRLKQQIEAIEGQMRQLPAEELEYARLTREVRINEELYTLLAKRYKESQISEADRVQSAFIITPAVEPGAPIKPNRMVNVSAGVFLGIFLGFILALIIENLDTSIGTIEDVEKYLSLPVLGVIPRIEIDPKQQILSPHACRDPKTVALRGKLIVYHASKSPFVESYHTLRTNLKLTTAQSGNGKGSIVAFSSSGIGEGKTITASNFALAAAQSGIKTLLVEIDLRRPSIHRVFGLPRDPGLTTCLTRTKKWSEVMRGTTDFVMSDLAVDRILQSPGIENLKIITSGPVPPNPIDLFNSSVTAEIFREIAQQFELVVLDCPPILLFADTLIVGMHTTGVIIVYKAGKIARGALKRAKDQLTNVRVPVLGVVLNDLTALEMEPSYGYYYSYKYYAPNDAQDNAK